MKKSLLLIAICLLLFSSLAWGQGNLYCLGPAPVDVGCTVANTYAQLSTLKSSVTLQENDIVDGQGNTFNEIWNLTNINALGNAPITLRNATVNSNNWVGISLNNSHQIQMKNLTVENPGWACILIQNSHASVVEDSEVKSCRNGIQVAKGSNDAIISGSRIINVEERGIFVSGNTANIEKITITNNLIEKTDPALTGGNQHGIHLLTEALFEINEILISDNTITLGTANNPLGSMGIWFQTEGESHDLSSGMPEPRICFNNFKIINNEVSYTGQHAITVSQASISAPSYNYIENNTVHHNGPKSANQPTLGIWVGRSDRVIISGNVVYDNVGHEDLTLPDREYGFDNVGIYLDAMASECIVRYNVTYGHNNLGYRSPFYNLEGDLKGAFISSGLGICCGAHDNELYYNISYGNTIGLSLSQSSGINTVVNPDGNGYDPREFYTHSYGNKIYNNVLAGNEVGISYSVGYVADWLNPTSNPGIQEVIDPNCTAVNQYCNELKNNIIYNNHGIFLNDGTVTDGYGAGMWIRTGAEPPIEDSNYYYGNDESPWDNGSITGNDALDPLFISPQPNNPDFSLSGSSTLIDAGTDAGLTQDFCGNPVPEGGGPDIGAFEGWVDRTVTWNGSTSSVWSDSLNWDQGRPPGLCDNVIIPDTSNDPVLQMPVSVNTLTVEPGGILDLNGKAVTAVHDMTINGMLDASFEAPTITVGDNLTLLSPANFSYGNSHAVFTGTGAINSSDFYGLTIARGANFGISDVDIYGDLVVDGFLSVDGFVYIH